MTGYTELDLDSELPEDIPVETCLGCKADIIVAHDATGFVEVLYPLCQDDSQCFFSSDCLSTWNKLAEAGLTVNHSQNAVVMINMIKLYEIHVQRIIGQLGSW